MPTQRLSIHISDSQGTRRAVFDQDVVPVGRDSNAILRVQDSNVSRQHGRLQRSAEGWSYEDLGSRHGSYLNGQKLPTGQPSPLKVGDVLHLGAATLTIENGAPEAAFTDVAERSGGRLSDAETVAPWPKSTAIEIEATTRSSLSIGRAIDNRIVIKDPHVSSYHAEAYLQGNGLIIRDLDSLNGTFVGNERIRQAPVPLEAEIRLGPNATLKPLEIIRQLTSSLKPSLYRRLRSDLPHLIVASRIGRQVGQERRPILRDVDIALRRGEILGIAGGSGAGKSTLMKVLNGYVPPDDGRMMVADCSDSVPVMGYVPQDDIIHRELPLRDAVLLSARMRFPPETPMAVIERRTNDVLRDLGLQEHGKTVVSRLSGGQRKRASVALELMTRPQLLLLDEPTSGLDPASAIRLLRLLRSLADSGYGIIIVTHATWDLEQCDTVSFLATGGYLVFTGTPGEARHHFETTRLDEIYEMLESKRSPQEWRQLFVESKYYPRLRDEVEKALVALQDSAPSTHRSGHSRRFRWQLAGLVRRYYKVMTSDVRNLVILLVQIPVILLMLRLVIKSGVLMVSESEDPRTWVKGTQLLMLLAATVTWLGIFNSVREICKELPIWQRERHVGVGSFPYLLSKVIVLGGLCAVQAVVLAAGFFALWEVDLGGGLRIAMGTVLFVAAISAMMLGLFISSIANSQDRAAMLAPLVMIPQVIFAGTVTPISEMNMAGRAIAKLVSTRWALEGLKYLRPYSTSVDSWTGPIVALSALSFGLGIAVTSRLARDSMTQS